MNFSNFNVVKAPEKKTNKVTITNDISSFWKVFQYCDNCRKPTVQYEKTNMNFICTICNKK